MKTSLLSIQPVKGTNEFQALMLIGDKFQGCDRQYSALRCNKVQ